MLQLNRKAADKQHVSTLLLSTLVEHHCWSAMGACLGYLAVPAQCCWTAAEYKKAADQQHVSTLLPSNVGGTIADQHPWLITTNSKTHDNLREDIIGAWQDGKVDSEHLPGSWQRPGMGFNLRLIAEQQLRLIAEQQLRLIAEQQFEASAAEQQHCKPSRKPRFWRSQPCFRDKFA